MAVSRSTTLNPNLDVARLRSLLEQDAAAGYLNPSTGEWISQSSGSVIDPNNPGMEFDSFGLSGMTPNELSAYGVGSVEEFAQKYGLNPDSQYMYGTGGESGHGKLGDQYSIYDGQGTDTGSRGTYLADWSPEALAAKYTAALLGAGAAGGMFAGQGIPGLVGGSAGGPGSAGWGMGLDSVTGGSGALEAMGGGSAAMGGGTAAMGAGGGSGAIGTMAPLELMPTGMGEYALPGAMSMGTGATGSLLGKALGIGSGLLGAVSGAQGQNQSSTTTREMTPELKPYIFGENGLLPQVQQQLLASRSPERMAQWDQIRNTGLGLLNRPMVGNPTAGWQFNR